MPAPAVAARVVVRARPAAGVAAAGRVQRLEQVLRRAPRDRRLAEAVADLRARARRATCFNGQPTWRGMPRETFTSPTATATVESPSSTNMESSSSPGDREAPIR